MLLLFLSLFQGRLKDTQDTLCLRGQWELRLQKVFLPQCSLPPSVAVCTASFLSTLLPSMSYSRGEHAVLWLHSDLYCIFWSKRETEVIPVILLNRSGPLCALWISIRTTGSKSFLDQTVTRLHQPLLISCTAGSTPVIMVWAMPHLLTGTDLLLWLHGPNQSICTRRYTLKASHCWVCLKLINCKGWLNVWHEN